MTGLLSFQTWRTSFDQCLLSETITHAGAKFLQAKVGASKRFFRLVGEE